MMNERFIVYEQVPAPKGRMGESSWELSSKRDKILQFFQREI